MGDQPSPRPSQDEYAEARSSKFRFKPASSSRSKRTCQRSRDTDERMPSKRRSRSRHGSPQRRERDSKRRRSRKTESRHSVYEHTFSEKNGEYSDPAHRHRESLYDDLYSEASTSHHLDSAATFRESLFDALADDEGAAYWEGVYGQPIHSYPNVKPGPKGELEQMDDAEYADYVRRKMWEKSHEHILEEREAKERECRQKGKTKARLHEEAAKAEAERQAFQRRVEASLKRGEERKKAKEAEAAWSIYLRKWDQLKSNSLLSQETEDTVRELIPWPVVSGKRRHVTNEEIEYFLQNSSAWRADATAMLKAERVRWHPDKVQQRFGQHIDSATMQSVTAVFQVIDKLWNDRKVGGVI
ncbi:hypothetical protein BCR34DRAFT_626895 [Clohesyomyces aquaticus]|uniref:Uncharacterized protein n=1 Tax=Clohesyomyces aquaticus TaxID=1231657 RepID=A0A1Y1Z4G0_9PLEO|nr:hypothetical protein BCR34DRAFT_626895 [Clohesyomyces aquaticus]